MAGRRRKREVSGAGAVVAGEDGLPVVEGGEFPPVSLPIAPVDPPMEALATTVIPAGGEWLYEPKWDGFRCVAFRDGDTVALQSKAGQPLDGEIVLCSEGRVGGFRYAKDGVEIGSLLLGLHDDEGVLNHVGFSSSFKAG